jgi:hypothetical protein
VDEHVARDVVRLSRRLGRVAIARRLGITVHQVRQVLGVGSPRRLRIATKASVVAWLRAHADDEGYTLARMARELRLTVRAVSATLWRHGISRSRLSLTPRQVEPLTGRSVATVLRAIGRGTLPAHQQDGAWRVMPTALRRWILDCPERVDPARVEDWYGLAWLLGGLWGVSSETQDREERRARQRERAKGDGPPSALGPPARGGRRGALPTTESD